MNIFKSMKIRTLDMVVALYIFGVMTSELMGAKTFPVATIGSFHLNATVAVFVLPLLFTMTDAVVEVYGRARARSMIFAGLVTIALLFLFLQLATSLPPSERFSKMEPAYDAIFGASARIALASLAAFAAAELLDVAIFSKLRQKMHNKALWFRNNASNFVSQFVDSAVFLVLAFYAFDMSFGANFSFLLGLLIPYWLLRCLLSLVETPLVYAGVWWLRRDKEAPAAAK
ncbi:MAG TPA: queuosine precursor transporter [Candidatus Polarisedimenticolaceae bacterium]|nr:queuosine precursor transporter [Candidatus Polarisedimenticolaceae bacterium]